MIAESKNKLVLAMSGKQGYNANVFLRLLVILLYLFQDGKGKWDY